MEDCLARLIKMIGGAVFSGFLFPNPAIAVCAYEGPALGKWDYANNHPIGPATLQVLAKRFQPLGTIFFDQTFPMTALLGGNPDAVLIKCQTEADAAGAGAALRLDDSYQLGGGFIYNGIRYYYTAYQAHSGQHSPVGWKLYGILPDGTERSLIFNDDPNTGNTAVRFMPLTYRSCTETGTLPEAQCAVFPYVITAADFPSIRLVLIRSDYDDVTAGVGGDRDIGRIGFVLSASALSSQADYGFIRLSSEYGEDPSPACGITQVPRTVDLGTHPISTIAANAASWSSFDVTYECSTANSPVDSLRIGFEPQNRSRLHTDYRYLLPDDASVSGVGIVYRRSGGGARNWIQNSGCMGISTDTANHSNCGMASGQSREQGWYQARPNTSGPSSTADYMQYTEAFEAKMEPLPDSALSITAGHVSATVNVLVNQP